LRKLLAGAGRLPQTVPAGGTRPPTLPLARPAAHVPELPALVRGLRRTADVERQHGLRFILETREPVGLERVAQVARERLGDCQVEPLFPKVDPAHDPRRLSTFFLARLPCLRAEDLPQSPYDWAYAVRDRDDFFVSVAPDLPVSVLPVAEHLELESSAGLCFLDDSQGQDEPRDWSLEMIGATQAWQLPPAPGGAARGLGIRVGHLDTGYAAHSCWGAGNEAIDLNGAHNFLDDNDDPTDPLEDTWLFELGYEQPGHGTGTGSVMVSRGDANTMIGVAPQARIVPIRCVRSVIITYNASDLARAIAYAVDNNCQVISMSLGGLGARALERAIDEAVARNVLVLAAAGNCVREVTAPALYANCIAVAGVNRQQRPWAGSCRGSAVAVSAPAEFVWVANRAPNDNDDENAVRTGQGTSFAVATLAGVAALWLAHHGLDSLLGRYDGRATLQSVFGQLLRQTAANHRGPDWDESNFGAGIAHAGDLLAAALPDVGAGPEAGPVRDYYALLETALGPETAAREVSALVGVSASAGREALASRLEPVGAEVLRLLHEPAGRRTAALESAGTVLPGRAAARGSAALRAMLPG
jgi:serine protease